MLTFKSFLKEVAANDNSAGGIKVITGANDNKKKKPIDESIKWDFSRGDQYKSGVKGFKIVNHRTGFAVGKAKTEKGAIKAVDNHDNKYGAYAHSAHPIYESDENSKDVIFEDEKTNSEIAKKAHKGENVGHGGFNKVSNSAAKEYGSKKAGEKVAAAVMWKKYGHKENVNEALTDIHHYHFAEYMGHEDTVGGKKEHVYNPRMNGEHHDISHGEASEYIHNRHPGAKKTYDTQSGNIQIKHKDGIIHIMKDHRGRYAGHSEIK